MLDQQAKRPEPTRAEGVCVILAATAMGFSAGVNIGGGPDARFGGVPVHSIAMMIGVLLWAAVLIRRQARERAGRRTPPTSSGRIDA